MEGVTIMHYYDIAITTVLTLSIGALFTFIKSWAKNHALDHKQNNQEHEDINKRMDLNDENDLIVQRGLLTDTFYVYKDRGYVYRYEKIAWIERYDRYKKPLPSGKVGNSHVDSLRKEIDTLEVRK